MILLNLTSMRNIYTTSINVYNMHIDQYKDDRMNSDRHIKGSSPKSGLLSIVFNLSWFLIV